MIRISLRTDRNINHRRISANRARPCDRQNIALSGLVRRTHHHCREWIYHIPGFPYLFSHFFAPSTAAVPKPVSVQAVSFWTPHPLARSSPDFLSDQTQRSSFLLLRFRRIKSSEDSATILVSIKKIISSPCVFLACSR